MSIAMAIIIVLLLSYIVSQRKPKKMNKIKIKDGDYQVTVIVNKDLKMNKGKVLSQFGHAIDSLHEKFKDHPELVKAWRNNGSAKIALKGTQDDLNKIYFDAKKANILYVRIFDAGLTQVKPGSNTVIVVGPATKKELEQITGHLPLY
jgi:PTH2 family peptidyl-tRNA hydrolase